jgi:hypothetical protein
MSYTQNTEDYIINKKYKSLVKDILSYSELPSYFLSIDFIIYLGKINNLLIKLDLCPTEYNYHKTILNLFFVKDPITKIVINIPLTPIAEISNKILDVLFELVELLKIPSETQNMLLSLLPNNCEILFKILSNLDVINYLDINFLFNNYNYLLRNNIELIQNKFLLNNDIIFEINKQLFKQAVKEDIRTLLFIPDDKLSFSPLPKSLQVHREDAQICAILLYGSCDIIKIAVQNNGLALKYVKPILFFKKYICSKKNIINIIEIAVQNNGLALRYIRSIFLLFSYKYKYNKEIIINIIELAVRNNGLALEFVRKEYLYLTEDIIKYAIQNNGLALEFVDDKYLTKEIIELAVQNNGLALQYALREYEYEYEDDHIILIFLLTYDLCKLAVQNNALALQYVPYVNRTEELCIIAVQNNILALQYVPQEFQTEELYMIVVQSYTLDH